MERLIFLYLILIPIFALIPVIILYFIIKFAVKNAIRELRKENTL